MDKGTIQGWLLLGLVLFGIGYCASQGSGETTTSLDDQYFQDVAEQAKSDWEIEQDAANFQNYVEEQNDLENQNDFGSDIMFCADTDSMVGEYAFCKIPIAFCSYQPSEAGSPTFCNDKPYPNNDFTLVVWDQDWSDYDGRCILVDGIVTTYGGNPQIIATDRRQVQDCE